MHKIGLTSLGPIVLFSPLTVKNAKSVRSQRGSPPQVQWTVDTTIAGFFKVFALRGERN